MAIVNVPYATNSRQKFIFSVLFTVKQCLAFYVDCGEDVYVGIVARIDAEYANCPEPQPDECEGHTIYVACYSSLTVYLNSCENQDCTTGQACL